MKINSINSNQSFGRLKITATNKGEEAREQYAEYAPLKKFDDIDRLSGETPVEIKFDEFFVPNEGYVTIVDCNIKGKKFIYQRPLRTPADFYKQLDCIKNKLESQRNQNTVRKYFA